MDNPSVTSTAPNDLIACHECDLVQRTPVPHVGSSVCCRRCGARLYRVTRDGLDRCLAMTIAAGVFFIVANAFPIVSLELQGRRNATTLFGAVHELYSQDMELVAALVFITTIMVPALELLAMTWLLAPLKIGRVAPGLSIWYRWVRTARPWGMIEVFMLGVLVSLAKLAHVATVEPGVALWSFGALVILLAAAASSFDPHELWARVDRLTSAGRAAPRVPQ
jgi:paraquat-inducible protein A